MFESRVLEDTSGCFCSPQFKYRLIRSLNGIFGDILDTVDAATDLNVDVEIKLTQKELIVRHYPLICALLLYLLSILVPLYLACSATVDWLSAGVLGVAVISLFRTLKELLRKSLGALSGSTMQGEFLFRALHGLYHV